MSARTHQVESTCTTATATAFAAAPIFFPTSRSPVVSGQTHARTFPVIAAANGSFTSYPPQHDDNDDEKLQYTYASFREEPVAALSVNACRDDTWTLAIEVPIPSLNNPTLLALHYLIKYATTGDNGNSTIQTDTILTATALPQGVVTESDLGIYRSETGYAPRMVDHDQALRLSTTLAIKGNGGGEQWSHYVDNQHVTPNVRVVDKSHLYVVFHVAEYPTVRTVRSLSVEVSATWQKEEVEKKAREEAERKAREEAEKKAKDEKERREREAEEKKAREEEKQAREEERQARKEEREAREEERRGKKPSVADAPAVADDKVQENIAETMKKLGLEPCPAGYGFKKTEWGYQCEAGGHKVTFEQLGMK